MKFIKKIIAEHKRSRAMDRELERLTDFNLLRRITGVR